MPVAKRGYSAFSAQGDDERAWREWLWPGGTQPLAAASSPENPAHKAGFSFWYSQVALSNEIALGIPGEPAAQIMSSLRCTRCGGRAQLAQTPSTSKRCADIRKPCSAAIFSKTSAIAAFGNSVISPHFLQIR